MSTQADVKSIDTLAFVKAAMATYAHETGQALAEVELEGRRAVDYITVDRAAYWKHEVRRCNDMVNQAIKDVANLRGRLGAFQKNTLGSTINSLNVALENVSSSESAIRDTDFATETSNLTRSQILVQSATSVLSQANQSPQAVLKLLG